MPTRLMRLASIVALLWTSSTGSAAGQPHMGKNDTETVQIQGYVNTERYRVTQSDRSGRLWKADNKAQRFTAHFGHEDIVLVPRSSVEPSWEFRFRLVAWGATHDLRPVQPASAFSEGNRFEYRRGPLTEWYVNTVLGLEQGFTIEYPPGDDIDDLVLEMALNGGLTSELSESGKAVTFQHEASGATLTYSGAIAWDDRGEALEVRMHINPTDTRLRLVIAVENATWPITVDPVFSLAAKLVPRLGSDTSFANFGRSVAVDGDIMVAAGDVLANGWGAGTVHVFQRDPGGLDSWEHVTKITPIDEGIQDATAVAISGDTVLIGSVDGSGRTREVRVFRRNMGGPDAWGEVAEITPQDGSTGGRFGFSIDIDGDTTVIGAPSRSVDGTNIGVAFVFQCEGGDPESWRQVAELTTPTATDYGYFGYAVGISNETVIVGAPQDRDGTNRGSVYVFGRDQGGFDTWGQVATLEPADGESGAFFGNSVAVQDNTAVVGDREDSADALWSGAAYVFQHEQSGSGVWEQVAKLTADDATRKGYFGHAVALSGDTVVVGVPGDDDPSAGSAYVFRRDQGGLGVWGKIDKVSASGGADYDLFGWDVAISGDTAVFGAPYRDDEFKNSGSVYVFRNEQEDTGVWAQVAELACPAIVNGWWDHFGKSVSIDGDTAVVCAPDDFDGGSGLGWVHIFRRDEGGLGAWGQVAKITADDENWYDNFCRSVAISGDTVIIGAFGDNDNGDDSGSAYIFQRDYGGPEAWGQVAKLTASNVALWGYFGISVSISGDTAVVGAPGYDFMQGYAYIFERDHGGPDAWGQAARITPSDSEGYNRFGYSVAISGDTIISAAPWLGVTYFYERDQSRVDTWEEVARPISGMRFIRSVSLSGDTAIIPAAVHREPGYPEYPQGAHILQRDKGGSNSWGLVAKIAPGDLSLHDHFGSSVSISNDIAVVGSSGDDDLGRSSGSVYFFHRNAGGRDQWRLLAKTRAFDGEADEYFGSAVAISDGTVIVGAPYAYEVGVFSGSAYVFTIDDLSSMVMRQATGRHGP